MFFHLIYLRSQRDATTTMSTHITKQYDNVTLGPFWEPLVASVAVGGSCRTRPGCLRWDLGSSWRLLDRFGELLCALGAILEPLGPLLEGSGGVWEVLVLLLGGSGAVLERSWAVLEGSGRPSCGNMIFGRVLNSFWGHLVRPRGGQMEPKLDPKRTKIEDENEDAKRNGSSSS